MPIYNTITFEEYKIIVIIDNNNIIWFNAKQICTSLDYKQPKQAIIKNVDKDDKIQLKNMNISFNIEQQPDSIYINEAGLYSLLISGKTKRSKKFNKWLITEVLPKLRKKNVDTSDEEINKLLQKINELEKYNKVLQNDLKIEKFPEGAMVYVVKDYDLDGTLCYKLGKTDDMNKRIKIYNTHSIHKKEVVHYVEIKCPLQLESCIKSMLYNYKVKNKKDFFKCSLEKIIQAFDKCLESIKCIECENDDKCNEQNGGNNTIHKVMYFQDQLNEIYGTINVSSIE